MRLLKKTHHEWASTHQSIRELRLQSLIKGTDFLVFVTSVNKSLVLRGKKHIVKITTLSNNANPGLLLCGI